mmetsp:Transcript_93724/g.264577  ORF Transcript_93724/g.264577 Transcript_93724/m.264577 type:complete len:267 (-) Transcript_93724:26-826(-)
MPPARRLFRRGGGGFLCLAQENLEDWVGDAIATSTNRHFEGIHRRNWWGFAGRRSADAALHERVGDGFLVHACRAQARELPFGEVLVTEAGPNLRARHVLHTVVPCHPRTRDPRPLPPARAADFATSAEHAEELLAASYSALIRAAAGLTAQTLCCPALGCGCRGFPLEVAARVGLDALAAPVALAVSLQEEPSKASTCPVPYVEVRFWENRVFDAWLEECARRDLVACEAREVEEALWGGEPLHVWHERETRLAPRFLERACTVQ